MPKPAVAMTTPDNTEKKRDTPPRTSMRKAVVDVRGQDSRDSHAATDSPDRGPVARAVGRGPSGAAPRDPTPASRVGSVAVAALVIRGWPPGWREAFTDRPTVI